jgi:murein DD-endopeptidase MepM/ murein hydrolase activator NlpD
MDFLCDETSYSLISSTEYEAAFLDTGYAYPVIEGTTLTSGYGLRDLDGDGVKDDVHSGIDLAGSWDDPIYAIADGEVVSTKTGQVRNSSDPNAPANYVRLIHNKGTENEFYSLYWHLNQVNVKKGDTVKAGQIVGTMGNSGYTLGNTGIHLHFAIQDKDGHSINPLDVLNDSPVDKSE